MLPGRAFRANGLLHYAFGMGRQLFRKEAVEARQMQALGVLRLSAAVSSWGLAALAIGLAGALATFAFAAEIARKSHVSGVLLPAGGQLDLKAVQPGRVSTLKVTEGQAVAEGDVVLVLAVDRETAAGPVGARVAGQLASRREALESERRLRSTQVSLQQQALGARVQAMLAELRRADDEISLAERRRALVQQQAERLGQLVTAGFVSATQAQSQQQELLEAEARVQQLHRSRIALERDRANLEAEGAQLGAQLQTELAQVDRQLASLDQERVENEARQTEVVTAPKAGTVTLLGSGAGQTVQPGQLLVSIAPAEAPLEAHLFAPSRTIGFAEVGQPVQLRYAAFPYQKFGLQRGQVSSVSRSPVTPTELPVSLAQIAHGAASGAGVYRVAVELERQRVVTGDCEVSLKSGMAVDAVLIHEHRRIIEWMFDPMFAVIARRT